MIGAIVLTHGQFGVELLKTAEGIVGKQEGVFAVSNANETYDAVKKRVIDEIQKLSSVREVVLFVDMPGGSCWRVAQEVFRASGEKRLIVLSGINLPMLLSFFVKRQTVGYDEIPYVLEVDGKKAIHCG
ncbi:MAG: PTS galactitol transporter subunit IIBC [Candidatus Latescibacteria bacterium]|nr:PTS galactitol transporter subunit IIBC [Candidatus Latescibacterota bacterium]